MLGSLFAEQPVVDLQDDGSMKRLSGQPHNAMPKYVIEREIAGAGKLTPEQLRGVAQKS